MKFTNQEKMELLGLDKYDIYHEVRTKLYAEFGEVISEEEVNAVRNALESQIELEVEMQELQNNAKASFRLYDDKVIVIKAKKLNIKLVFMVLLDSTSIFSDNGFKSGVGILKVLFDLFFTELDDECSTAYIYLAYRYFEKKEKIEIDEVFNILSRHSKDVYGNSWNMKKIQDILHELEYEMRVIEFVDGYLRVKDEIYELVDV